MDDETLKQPTETIKTNRLYDSNFTESKPIDEFLMSNIKHILRALADLQDLDAFEVLLKTHSRKILKRLFHVGKLTDIWSEDAYSGSSNLLIKYLLKGEVRAINLPNRRMEELSQSLKEKAFGQVLCFPIVSLSKPIGMICVAHTRKKFFGDHELNFIRSISDWIANMISYEQHAQSVRAEIITEERERIGMDLHDGIIQSLYGIGLSLEKARVGLVNGKGDGITEIKESMDALDRAIADIRAYILDLRPRQLHHNNLLEGMQSLIREFRANTMVDVDLVGSSQDVDGLARPQMEALYHIFQESLSNTAKHARATKVSVRLWRQDDRVMLRVNDNGAGFEIGKPKRRIGHGLANMRARAEGVGGGIEVISIHNQGTTLLAWMPYIRDEEYND
ncbi:MAG: GAF domain-containing sensor histidine kinase [Anaerolineaceae bacterium]|nr:GAF domain-containing sensor histidine kinase [Anaerolineaceae bacterium]